MSDKKTILGIYAHPDDEILGSGGTLARYAAEGADVVLVVATRGEAGEIQNPGTATPETLPQVREQEMRCSAATLGATDVIFLGYRDSGMAGTPENEDPRAFVNAPADEVVTRLVALIRRLRPQAIITFGPDGGYGHPDHIAIHQHTVAAFKRAADPGRYPELGELWRVDRLLYHVLPGSLFLQMKQHVAERGGDVSGFDESIERRNRPDAVPDEAINIVVDVSAYIERKWDAWNCHRTQFGPESRFRRLPDEVMKVLLSTEHFVLAHPTLPDGQQLNGLFDASDSQREGAEGT